MKKLVTFMHDGINSYLNDEGHGAGYANGYVAVPKDHPYYGKDYDDIEINIHGGLTFSNSGSYILKEWENIEMIEGTSRDLENSWVFGFDTCHCGDNLNIWPIEAVIEETLRLKNQLEEVYE